MDNEIDDGGQNMEWVPYDGYAALAHNEGYVLRPAEAARIQPMGNGGDVRVITIVLNADTTDVHNPIHYLLAAAFKQRGRGITGEVLK